MLHVPTTEARVPDHTRNSVNRKIRATTLKNLQACIDQDAQAIDRRIAELRREWDIERTLEANAAAVTVVGTILGFTRSRRFFALPGLVVGFLLQHAVQGWCPPLPVFRQMGIRTSAEIHSEILALRLLRGDFGDPPGTAEQALSLAEMRGGGR